MRSLNLCCAITAGAVIASTTPAQADYLYTDFEDIPTGTTYTTPGTQFFSNGIRFETAPLNLSPSGPQVFDRVEVDLANNLGFGPFFHDSNSLYPNNSATIIDFTSTLGTASFVRVELIETNGVVNFDVNNTDPGSVMIAPDSLELSASSAIRHGTYIDTHASYFKYPKVDLYLFGQINTLYIGGQNVLIKQIWAHNEPLQFPGDLNSDLFVGIEDLNLILRDWNKTVGPGHIADPTGDNFVGIEDLGVVLGNWNAGIPPWALPHVNLGLTTAPVPEPATLILLTLSAQVILMRRR